MTEWEAVLVARPTSWLMLQGSGVPAFDRAHSLFFVVCLLLAQTVVQCLLIVLVPVFLAHLALLSMPRSAAGIMGTFTFQTVAVAEVWG